MIIGRLVDTISKENLLVSEFRRGKTRAFEQIFLKIHGSILYFTKEFIKDPEAARDIVSELFVKLWYLRENFDDIRSVKAFLYVSAKHACLNYQRRIRLETSYRKSTLLELSSEELNVVVMKQIFDAEVIRALYTAIEALPAQCKRVVQLTMQGLSSKDIASMLNLSDQTVRNMRIRATQMLKQQLSANDVI